MEMEMRRSKALEMLKAGDVVCVAKLNTTDPRLFELAAISGFPVLWADMEHMPNDWGIIENAIRAAKVCDVDVMVRVARGSYSDYIRAFEADASGIMVPHVMSVEDAAQVVRMTRFHPLGRRPIDGGSIDGGYGRFSLADYTRQANERRFVCIQIEDPEPMSDLDAIVSMPGIDIVFFGPADYSHALGVPGNLSDPRVVSARERIAEACARYDKIAGTVGSPSNLAELVGLGYRFVNVASQVAGLGEYFRGIRTATDELINKGAAQ